MTLRIWAYWVSLIVLLPSASLAEPLVLWHSYRGAEQEALDEVLREFSLANPDAPKIQALAVPYDALASKLTTAMPRGHGPDVFIFAHERAGGWAQAGLIEAMDGEVTPEEIGSFFETTVEALRFEGSLYGLPLAFKSLVLFYNRALVPSPPKNTDELLVIGDALVAEGKLGLAYQASQFYFHAPWYFGFGGELDVDAPKLGLSSEGAKASYEFVRRLYERGVMPEEPTGSLVTKLFNAQSVGMVINGPWFLGEIGEDVDFGVSPLPVVSQTGKPASPFLSDEAVFVSSKTARRDASVALARYLAGEKSAVIRATRGRQVVAHRAAWDGAGLYDDPVLSVFRQQVDAVVPMSNDPRMRNVWEPGDLALKKIGRGGATAEQAGIAAERRYAAITRPPPEPVEPGFFMVALLALALLALMALVRWVVDVVRTGQIQALGRGARWVGPGLLVIGVLVFVPFIVSLCLSFFSHRAGIWEFVGFGNFISILQAQSFGILEPLSFYYALLITVAWTGLNIVLHVGFGVGLAVLLNQKGLRLRAFYRVLLIIPWAVPNYITALIWKGMFHRQFGAINAMLELMGFDGISWFSSAGTAFFANVCTNAWLGFPFILVVTLGALQAIPSELYDAAEVDGAGAFQQFRLITFPLLKPALVPAILLGIVWTFNQFNIVYLVSSGEPDNSTDILISEVYRWAFGRREQYGYAAAYAGLIFVLLLGWSIWSARMARRVEEAI